MNTCGQCQWEQDGWCRRVAWGFLNESHTTLQGDVASEWPACPAFVLKPSHDEERKALALEQGRMLCSVCGKDIRTCNHVPSREYGGKTCEVVEQKETQP